MIMKKLITVIAVVTAACTIGTMLGKTPWFQVAKAKKL
jgi:hypothetical protein